MSTAAGGPGVAVVSGGGSGIGAGIAERLAADGHPVAVLDVDAAAGSRTVAAIVASGGFAHAWPVDVRDHDAIDAAVAEAAERLGVISVLSTNAAVSDGEQDAETLAADDAQRLVEVNLLGAFFCVQAVLPRMANGGAIVLTASTSGLRAHPGAALYAATKLALVGLVRSLAVELAPRAIRVTAVCPGGTDTPMVRRLYDEVELAASADAHPLGRLGTPDDVAAAVSYLVQAPYVSGVALPVDGGAMWVPGA